MTIICSLQTTIHQTKTQKRRKSEQISRFQRVDAPSYTTLERLGGAGALTTLGKSASGALSLKAKSVSHTVAQIIHSPCVSVEKQAAKILDLLR